MIDLTPVRYGDIVTLEFHRIDFSSGKPEKKMYRQERYWLTDEPTSAPPATPLSTRTVWGGCLFGRRMNDKLILPENDGDSHEVTITKIEQL